MKCQIILRGLLPSFAVLLCVACNSSPGKPGPAVVRPSEVEDFDVLYAQNCAGCHGPGGKGGAANALADPVFLAVADDASILRTITNGVHGTPMSAFAESAGGMLTAKQVDVLVHGIRSWAKPDALGGATPPPYAVDTTGDAQQGATAFSTYCSSCHSPDGKGSKSKKTASIVDGSYLALVSDQNLRTTIIAGRPDLGSPDWRNDVPGHPMSAQEVSDVVAWLAAQRPQFPGQPYAASSSGTEKKGLQ
jgi:cytochrome c oxidase cbb3-type subunit III